MGVSDLIRGGAVVEEKEYVFWCKVPEDVISLLLGSTQGYMFLDVFLKRNKDKTRLRVKSDGAEWTKKVKMEDGRSNEETNHPIPIDVAMSMAPYAENIHRVRRCEIPITTDGKPLLRKSNGEQLKWEIDVFHTSKKGDTCSPWIKVELEVDSFTSERLYELIPFSYLDLIDEEKKTPIDGATITDIWERETNVAI